MAAFLFSNIPKTVEPVPVIIESKAFASIILSFMNFISGNLEKTISSKSFTAILCNSSNSIMPDFTNFLN